MYNSVKSLAIFLLVILSTPVFFGGTVKAQGLPLFLERAEPPASPYERGPGYDGYRSHRSPPPLPPNIDLLFSAQLSLISQCSVWKIKGRSSANQKAECDAAIRSSDPGAQLGLASAFYLGQVENAQRDVALKEASKWFTRAAEQPIRGVPAKRKAVTVAAYFLGMMYLKDEAPEAKDRYDKALKWLKKAALLGPERADWTKGGIIMGDNRYNVVVIGAALSHRE